MVNEKISQKLKGHILSRKATLSKLFCLPPGKGFTLKGKNLLSF